MFHEFIHRQLPCTVDGVAENMILSRESRGNSVFYREYAFNAVFSPLSIAKTGSLFVVDASSYLVRTLRSTVEGDLYCSAIKLNYPSVPIQRKQQAYDSSGNTVGVPTWTTISTIPANVEHVNGNTPYKDGLLLASTVFGVTMQANVTVQMLDRLVLDGKPYKVDDINLSIVPGLQVVQLSIDTR